MREDVSPLLKLAFPLALTGIIQTSSYFFETVFLAHLNEEALAAGSLVSWFAGTFTVIIYGLLSSVNILVARAHGANDQQTITRVAQDGLKLAFFVAIPMVILLMNMAPLFLLFGQKPQIVALATPYLHALSLGILPTFIEIACLEFMLGLGRTRVMMLMTFLSAPLTILLSVALIFGKWGMPALGIAGAGYGMSITHWITAIFLLTYLLSHKQYRAYLLPKIKITRPAYVVELIKIGFPMGLMYCLEVAFFLSMSLMMGAYDSQLLAANQVTLQYMGALMSVIFSIAQAITIRMGHLMGQRKFLLAKRAAFVGCGISGAFISIFSLLYLLFPFFFIAIDFDLHNPKNLQIITYAQQLLMVCALFQLFEALRISLFGVLRSLKDTRFSLLTSIVSFWGIALPLGYWLLNTCEYITGLWISMTVGAIVGMCMLYWRFLKVLAMPSSLCS
jgi:MATE family multidrug resistance protein